MSMMRRLNFLLRSFLNCQLVCSIMIRPQPFSAQENRNLSVSCIAEEGESLFISLTVNGSIITALPRFISVMAINKGASFLFGPIARSDDGLVFQCWNEQRRSATLQVTCKIHNARSRITNSPNSRNPSIEKRFVAYLYKIKCFVVPKVSVIEGFHCTWYL